MSSILLTGRRETGFEKRAELSLVDLVLVDVRNAEFGLPEKRMSRSLKDLLLFRNRSEHHLQH